MACFPPDTRFCHPWRPYQERVLQELSDYLDDKCLHLVAAPGSGKTVLGLEVMRRLDRPTLILAPTLTIRDQWIDRFVTLFLPGGSRPEWLSTDLRQPGRLTVSTYQALHAACAGEPETAEPAADTVPEENGEETPATLTAGAAALASLLQAKGVGTVVVDECHHLRTEWWRSLEAVLGDLPHIALVALTATPPYDVPPPEWTRYQHLCGPIDAEIPAPDLVQAGNLCPHQDYVRFSMPTGEELARIQAARAELEAFVRDIVKSTGFISALTAHPWLRDPVGNAEAILEDPEYFSSMLIFLRAAGMPIPREARRVLGIPDREVPALTPAWLEVLLQQMLKEREILGEHAADLEAVGRRLRQIGGLERGRVSLRTTVAIDRALAASISKLQSITDIVALESRALGADLRLVVLTDFVRAEDLPRAPGEERPLDRLGVATIFERLRREALPGVSLAVLSGPLVIVPAAAEAPLRALAAQRGIEVRLAPLAHDPAYLQASGASGDASLVRLVTDLFSQGHVNALVGTAALLGEGWDAPAINTLVLASYVGSYMLSNQMRGRAIRTQPGNPDKTGNIWHLVCVEPGAHEPSADLETLTRRFQAFVGVGLGEPVIEGGMARLGIGPPPYGSRQVTEINQAMDRAALDRAGLRRRWEEALASGSRTVEQVRAPEEATRTPRSLVLWNTIEALAWEGAMLGLWAAAQFLDESAGFAPFREELRYVAIAFALGALIASPFLIKALWLQCRYGTVTGSLEAMGWAVVRGLRAAGLIRTPPASLRVVTERPPAPGGAPDDPIARALAGIRCRLEGATTCEHHAFLQALQEVLDPVNNPRYLVTRRSVWAGLRRTDYHAVPAAIGRKKEWAEAFAREWQRLLGRTELIYTRTPEGRLRLLHARGHSLAVSLAPRSERVSCWR